MICFSYGSIHRSFRPWDLGWIDIARWAMLVSERTFSAWKVGLKDQSDIILMCSKLLVICYWLFVIGYWVVINSKSMG